MSTDAKPLNAEIFSTELISDTLSTAIIVLDTQLQIQRLNLAAETLFRQSRQRLLNKPFIQLLENELEQEELLNAITFVQRYDEVHSLRNCRLRHKEGRVTTVDCVISPLPHNGVCVGLLLELYSTDHHVRIAREQQQQSQQEAAQILVRSMAHEIKNPLGGLRGAAQLLESELSNEALTAYTDIIIAEADRLQNLVDRMLGTREPSKREPTNIHEVLERVLRILETDIPAAVQITLDYDPSIPDFESDRDNLIQILLNILGNALNAVGHNGHITLRTRVERNQIISHKQHKLSLRVDICDDGRGVPENIRDKLFFPMISGSETGTGLGLSIAQALAHKQHGAIVFESSPGDTRFTLHLPMTLS